MNAIVKAPLEGEILGPGESVRVVAQPHPMRDERILLDLPAGASIAEIIAIAGEEAERRGLRSGLGQFLVVHLGPHAVPEELWPRVRVKAGVTITLRARPRGKFGAILKSILSIIVLAVASAFLGPVWGPIVGALANLVIGVLFPAAQPKMEKIEKGATYSIAGARNEARPYGPVPVILGKHRQSPDYGAKSYTEFAGGDQYLRLLFVHGYAPLVITERKIGETPVEDFDDVEIETFQWDPGDDIDLFPRAAFQEDLSVTLREDVGWQSRTTEPDINEISLDFIAPGGIILIDNKDGPQTLTIRLEWRYRPAAGGAWVTRQFQFKGKTQKEIRNNERAKVSKGQYEVQVRRLTQDHDDEDEDDNYIEDVVWTAIRGFRNTSPIAFSKPVVITVMRIRANEQLNGVVDTFNALASSRVTAWNGSSWVSNAESAWPADLYRHVLQSPANARPQATSRIDLPTIQLWHAYCVLKGWKFNMVRDFPSLVIETLRDICAAGRAVPIMRDGKWSVAWEDAAADVVQHFTPRNSWGFSFSHRYSKKPHALRIRFINEKKGYAADELVVYADGYNKNNATDIDGTPEFPGVTDPDIIYKFARYYLAEMELRPAVYRLSADIEYLACTQGDRVYVSHDVIEVGLHQGRVKSVDGAVVTLDEEVLIESGKLYGFRFRSVTGGSVVRTATGAEGFTDTLTLSGAGAMPEEGDLFAFGYKGKEAAIYRVMRVSPGDNLSADLELVDDALGVQDADDEPIPDYDSGITIPPDLYTLRPINIAVTEQYVQFGGVYEPVVNVSFEMPVAGTASSFEVQWRDDTGDRTWRPAGTVLQPFVQIRGLDPGPTSIRVRAIYEGGRPSNWSQITVNVLGFNKVPPDVTGFLVSVIGDIAIFNWDAAAEPVAFAEIRFSPATSGATWPSAIPIPGEFPGTTAQSPIQTGTYLIKWVSYGGARSANATLIVVTNGAITAMNTVLEALDIAPFEGEHEGTFDNGLGLELVSLLDIFALADLFAPADIFLGDAGFAPIGTYTLAGFYDLGEVFTSRLTGSLVAFGVNYADDVYAVPDVYALEDVYGVENADWSARIEVSLTLDDPGGAPVWTAFEPLVIGDYTARAFRFRVVLESFAFGITPRVTVVQVLIDMPDRIASAGDVAVGTGGLAVLYDPPFRNVPDVAITAQGLATGDYLDWGSKTSDGFNLIIRNSAGTPVARTVDWFARGYGRKLT